MPQSTINGSKQFGSFLGLLGVAFMINACGPDKPPGSDRPVLNLENGRFEVDVVVQEGIGVNQSGDPIGSGSLSFSFSGDVPSGSFAATGSLSSHQTASEGVGAILNLIQNDDFETFDEAISLLAFVPSGDGNADIFILNTQFGVPIDSLEPGFFYRIGLFGVFSGIYLQGIPVGPFWAGQSDVTEIADRSFVLADGQVFIGSRDSTHITGTFTGTTHLQQGLSKKLLD